MMELSRSAELPLRENISRISVSVESVARYAAHCRIQSSAGVYRFRYTGISGVSGYGGRNVAIVNE